MSYQFAVFVDHTTDDAAQKNFSRPQDPTDLLAWAFECGNLSWVDDSSCAQVKRVLVAKSGCGWHVIVDAVYEGNEQRYDIVYIEGEPT